MNAEYSKANESNKFFNEFTEFANLMLKIQTKILHWLI